MGTDELDCSFYTFAVVAMGFRYICQYLYAVSNSSGLRLLREDAVSANVGPMFRVELEASLFI